MFKLSSICAGLVLSMALAGNALAAGSAASTGGTEATVVPSQIISLTTSEGHSVSVEVDGYGAFKDAYFKPAGFEEADTTYEAMTFFSTEMQYLATSLVAGGKSRAVNVNLPSPTRTSSKFPLAKGSVRVVLAQELKEIPGGVTLYQTYTLRNRTAQPITVGLTRYHDVDLNHSGSTSDDVAGTVNDVLGAIDVAASATKLKPMVQIYTTSGTDIGATVRGFNELKSGIFNQGEIPVDWYGTVGNDANADGRSDFGFDLAAAAGSKIVVPVGRKVKLVVRTNFIVRNFR